jgi:L-galactose dehydrogenase/L-glyceraldehyde 3-phosphate reductase
MVIETCAFGPEATPISLLGFGCGALGGLMVRGSAADQECAVARAIDVGINYFDTAAQYGDGAVVQDGPELSGPADVAGN